MYGECKISPGSPRTGPKLCELLPAQPTRSDRFLSLSRQTRSSFFIVDNRYYDIIESPVTLWTDSSIIIYIEGPAGEDVVMADSNTPKKEQDWSKSCPICFVENVPLAHSRSCKHAFCIECLEQYFSLPSNSMVDFPSAREEENITDASDRDKVEDDEVFETFMSVKDLQGHNHVEGIPTLSRCPLCRAPISLLDLTNVSNGKSLWESKHQINTELEKSPLAGKQYATRRGIGFNSFHFPPFSESDGDHDSEEEEKKNPSLPYLLWQDDDALYLEEEDTDAIETQRRSPKKYYFEPGCFYFKPSRTFHGRLFLPDAHGNSNPQRHDILLSFASNYKWITGGILLRHHTRPQEQVNNNNQLEASQLYYPLEGSWKVTWYRERLPKDANLKEQRHLSIDVAHINVIGNRVVDEAGLSYQLRYTKDKIYFHWAGHATTQNLEPECDFRHLSNTKERQGTRIPRVGDYLKWTTTDPRQPYIVWERESVADAFPSVNSSIEYFGRSGGDLTRRDPRHIHVRNSQSWYRQWEPSVSTSAHNESNQDSQDGRPQYIPDRLWGNTFCQGLRVGLASYHFGRRAAQNATGEGEATEPYAYISYQHEMCGQWPPLDDGSPIPPQVYFHNISVEEVEQTQRLQNGGSEGDDEDNRETLTTSHIVFRGNIEWLQDYGTTWQNNSRWEYEMHFDSELTCIVSGTVHCISSDSSRREMSRYGTDLVYINAGISQGFETWMNESGNINNGQSDSSDEAEHVLHINSDSYQRYTHVSRTLRRRLQMEGASVRTVAMLNMVFTMSQQPGGSDPIDYNIT